MRAAEMKERPDFPLMRQTDAQSIYHMQMSRWPFSDPRYADMSLDAKVAYTFLLNPVMDDVVDVSEESINLLSGRITLSSPGASVRRFWSTGP